MVPATPRLAAHCEGGDQVQTGYQIRVGPASAPAAAPESVVWDSGKGAATVDVHPPRSRLRHARGAVHTQRGPVRVDWRDTSHGLVVQLEIPDNVRATVRLPTVDGARYRAAGQGSPSFVAVTDGRAVFETGSGHSTFTPEAPAGR